MHFGLRLGQTPKNIQRKIPFDGVESSRLDDPLDVAEVAMLMFGLVPDVDFHAAKSHPLDFVLLEAETFDSQGPDFLIQKIQGHAGIHQCAEDHVPTDSALAVKIG
jgi:hypothetical protein